MTIIQQQFITLLKTGLWGISIDLSVFSCHIDWKQISKIIEEQTCIGICMDAVVLLPKTKLPIKEIYFSLIKKVNDIEYKNAQLNKLIPKLISYLEKSEKQYNVSNSDKSDIVIQSNLPSSKYNKCISTLLLKGQGVATNYLNPNHRMPGDIDLFVGFDNSLNDKANDIMRHIASNIGHNDIKRKHAEYHVGKALVEIHGEIGTCVNKQCDNLVEEWAKKRLSEECRTIMLEDGKIKVPPYNFDALYIFLHFATHYMNGGVGLRQISDWMMYIHKNYDCIDKELLEKDIDFLNVRKIWKTFAAMAVDFLGYPKEKMPLYDSRYGNRGRVLLGHIFKTGNFGAKQKKWQLSSKHNAVLKKIITFSGQIPVYMDNIRLFPKDTLYCFGRFVKGGLNSL